jgi:histidine triad (HIT) family protein
MATIFTKIINREIPGYIVAEDEYNIAILDINPLAAGHTLVIPKDEVDYLFDMEDEPFIHLNLFLKKVSGAIRKVVPCLRIGVAVVGLEVPHAHIHLIPLNSVSDINFSRPKMKFSQKEFEDLAARIKDEFTKPQTA